MQIELPLTGIGNVKRDSSLVEDVLKADEYRIAVCGFDVQLRYQPVALEAAHFKWQQAGKPDTETNGMAPCVVHQRFLDRGAFTLATQLQFKVSDEANGFAGFQKRLMRYLGQMLGFPQRKSFWPNG